MKLSIKKTLALLAFCGSAFMASAQPAVKIVTVDLAKIYDGHYKTEDINNKLRGDEQKAQAEVEKMNKEGNTLVDQYKELVEQAKNPALSKEAQQKAEAAVQVKGEEIQRKQGEIQNFRNETSRSLQTRLKIQRDLILEEISKKITEIAKTKGATLVVDKSGPSLIGISNIIYADPAYDITDDVMKEVNKDRPSPATKPATTAAPTTDATTTASPTITVPGIKK
ncbi:MAG TPA: OmpH family outer membrane protein [Opitutaceae bacterium]|nr:OmpH family outer membrane protein [Opitutaceae bacterium]